MLLTTEVKIIPSIHIALADILVTKIKQGLGDPLPSNMTVFEKPESNQEQPQNQVRAQPCRLSSWWVPQQPPTLMLALPFLAKELLEIIQGAGVEKRGVLQDKLPKLPSNPWPPEKPDLPAPEVTLPTPQQGTAQTQHLYFQEGLMSDKQIHYDCTKK